MEQPKYKEYQVQYRQYVERVGPRSFTCCMWTVKRTPSSAQTNESRKFLVIVGFFRFISSVQRRSVLNWWPTSIRIFYSFFWLSPPSQPSLECLPIKGILPNKLIIDINSYQFGRKGWKMDKSIRFQFSVHFVIFSNLFGQIDID